MRCLIKMCTLDGPLYLLIGRIKIEFCVPKIGFVLDNTVDDVEMPHHAAFHLGLHCFVKVCIKESLVDSGGTLVEPVLD